MKGGGGTLWLLGYIGLWRNLNRKQEGEKQLCSPGSGTEFLNGIKQQQQVKKTKENNR